MTHKEKPAAFADDKNYEVVTSGYADFEEDGVFYRRKGNFFAESFKAT